MPIKITKKPVGEERRQAAPLMADALLAKVAVVPPERTPEVALKDWQDNMVAPDAKPRQCAYCKCFYLKPCDQGRSRNCLNYQHAQSKLGGSHG